MPCAPGLRYHCPMAEGGAVLSILNWLPIKRVRRAHALEHATVHVLSERKPDLTLMGRASVWGFTIYGDVDTAALTEAAREGLRRLQAGRSELAVHPHCGTNLAVAALLAAGSSALVARERSPWRRAWLALSAAAAVVAGSQALGARAQRHLTTSADVGGVTIRGVSRHQMGGLTLHRVHLGQS